jgi:hypothetical protein
MQLAALLFLPVTALHAVLCCVTSRENVRLADEAA